VPDIISNQKSVRSEPPPDELPPDEPPPLGVAISARGRITRGIMDAQSSGTIPIWLVFAVQELLDIFHITRKEKGRALAELRMTASKIHTSLKEYYTFSIKLYSGS
jgi:hypothetical protein